MESIKLAFIAFFASLWAEIKLFASRIVGRVKDFALHVWGAATSIVMMPVHAAQLLWGAVAHTASAAKTAWTTAKK